MREIHVDRIIEAVRDLAIRVCKQLGEAEIKALRHAVEFEVSPTGKEKKPSRSQAKRLKS
jgi:hypothetical protein